MNDLMNLPRKVFAQLVERDTPPELPSQYTGHTLLDTNKAKNNTES
jgi:hypothetical protein